MIKHPLIYLLPTLFFFSLNVGISQTETYIPFRKGDLWGYADTNRNIVLTPAFDEVVYSQNDLFIVKNDKQKALFGRSDKMLIDFKTQEIYIRSNFISVQKGSNHIYYSIKGSPIFPDNVIHSRKFDFDENTCAIVKTKTEKYGLIKFSASLDSIDEWLLDTIYQEITDLNNSSFLKIVKDDQVSKYHKDGRIEAIPEGKSIYDGEEDVFEFVDTEIDEEYSPNRTNRYNRISYALKAFLVGDHYQVSVQQKKGQEIIKVDTLSGLYQQVDTYTNYEYFKNQTKESENAGHSNWAFVINKDNKTGVMNSEGVFIIPCIYDNIDPNFFPQSCKTPIFSAQKDKKWGLIDAQNQIILDFKYEEPVKNVYRKGPEIKQRRTTCFNIYSGVVTKQNGKYGIVGKDGKILLPFEYDSIKANLEYNTFSLRNGDKHGLFVNEVSTEKKGVIIKKLLIEPMHHKPIKKQKTFHQYRVGLIHDKHHKFLGFIDAKGFYYFEE